MRLFRNANHEREIIDGSMMKKKERKGKNPVTENVNGTEVNGKEKCIAQLSRDAEAL